MPVNLNSESFSLIVDSQIYTPPFFLSSLDLSVGGWRDKTQEFQLVGKTSCQEVKKNFFKGLSNSSI